MADVRPIDGDSLLRYFSMKKANANPLDYNEKAIYAECVKKVETMPTLDCEPVRHGEWVWNGFDGTGWECSLCKHEESKEAKKPEASYCPNCGAKMDGGKGNA